MSTRKQTALALMALVLLVAPAPAQEGWIEYMTPGAQHRHMSALEGIWTYTAKMWSDPATEPVDSRGVAKKTMILGGRYLQEEMSGEMPMGLFSGMSLTGFDNHSKKYEAIWVDNMGTGIHTFTGESNDDGTVMTAWSEERYNPASGYDEKIRTVISVVSQDEHRFEYYVTRPGQDEAKLMEIVYVRKGAS